MPECASVLDTRRCTGEDRGLAAGLQWESASQGTQSAVAAGVRGYTGHMGSEFPGRAGPKYGCLSHAGSTGNDAVAILGAGQFTMDRFCTIKKTRGSFLYTSLSNVV
jgi:hypothetical protein